MTQGTSTGQSDASADLTTPVQFLKGVGPQRGELLRRLGLRTARDVLFSFPRDYREMGQLVPVEALREGQPACVQGVIDEVELQPLGDGRSLLGALVRQGSQFVRAVWFNQPFLRSRLRLGTTVVLCGTPSMRGFRWELRQPRIEHLGPGETLVREGPLPVYRLTEGLRQHQMRRIVSLVVASHAGAVDEVFPATYLAEHRLLPIADALRAIHAPRSEAELALARRRFIYQELLVLQLALALRRSHLLRQCQAPVLEATARIDARIRRLFPFQLTGEQQQAIADICGDMGGGHPMNRLLQGDVGSGKTVVAEYAMLLTVAHGYQAVMMAPTEVLARQHARTLERDLHASRVRIGLLTGALTAAERRRTLDQIASGELNLIVGTHAVVQDDVRFDRLGLVVIDEQHKFGVRQRAMLRQSGLDPHYLVMTATPIPRTVSMTLFGDLDCSTLRQGPPGRQAVHTYLAAPDQRARWWQFVRKKLLEGRQAYVIAPLIDENENLTLASVRQLEQSLRAGELAGFELGLVHGGLSAEEKAEAMERFHRGLTRVLIATSVIEVGIDVPNATLMTIEDGQRFGLSQLHQLRGRISRGKFPGYLCVFAEMPTAESRQRLEAFASTSDGFELAEIDFQLRGPGDLLGTRQHGLPPLRIADLHRDRELLEEARHDAQGLIAADPDLAAAELGRLKQMVLRRYGAALDLGDVG
ncbi:MAG: ATP-dependent DNA helicase RecG [Pirellulaceae bacterium]|nr:ATP-dependent DNA helicase RecG [Pirellulaceae bacterium]